jgi:hypothetical protein
MNAADQQRIRLRRLRQIAEDHTEEIHDAETRDQLAGLEPVTPFAAVISAGSAESSFYKDGGLLVFGTKVQMEATLARQAVDSWVAHGRIWNLDSEWDPWGNLELICTVQVREVESGG